jgi:Glycoside Hydrolase Family 113
MPLDTGSANPTVDQLIDAWKPYVDRISALHDKIGKPVLFTELGYQSRLGAALHPSGGSTGGEAQVPQARAYDAAFRVWSVDKPWFGGIYRWVWPAEVGQPGEAADFTPQGKLAQNTLERSYAYPPVG